MNPDIRFKAVEYGTCDLQQIAKIDNLILKAKQEEREKVGKVRKLKIVKSKQNGLFKSKGTLRPILEQQVIEHRNEWLMKGVQEMVEEIQGLKIKEYVFLTSIDNFLLNKKEIIKHKSLLQRFGEWLQKVGI